MTTNRKDTRMRGLRPTEGRVDRSCKGDGEPSNGRLGYPSSHPVSIIPTLTLIIPQSYDYHSRLRKLCELPLYVCKFVTVCVIILGFG